MRETEIGGLCSKKTMIATMIPCQDMHSCPCLVLMPVDQSFIVYNTSGMTISAHGLLVPPGYGPVSPPLPCFPGPDPCPSCASEVSPNFDVASIVPGLSLLVGYGELKRRMGRQHRIGLHSKKRKEYKKLNSFTNSENTVPYCLHTILLVGIRPCRMIPNHKQ